MCRAAAPRRPGSLAAWWRPVTSHSRSGWGFGEEGDASFPSKGRPWEERYTKQELLEEGGFGRILRVVDKGDGREFVVKEPRLADGESLRRFRREIETQAGIHDPHVMPVLDSGEDWFVMPYATVSLADRAPEMYPNEVLMAFEHAALGLHAAHSKGLVHRDVKPHNILLLLDAESQRRWVVADFGLVRRPRGETTGMPTRGFVGTDAFAAPEARAAAHDAGPHADVYSLGRSLLWVLTGRVDGTAPEAWQPLTASMVADAIVERPTIDEVIVGLKKIRSDLLALRRANWGKSDSDLSNDEIEVLAAVLSELTTPNGEREQVAHLKDIVRACPTLFPAGVRIQLKSLEDRSLICVTDWPEGWNVTDGGWTWLRANQHRLPIKRPPPDDVPF